MVTAAASVGYFIAPLFTKYSLGEFGWEETLRFFLYFILIGSVVSIFIFAPKKISEESKEMIKEQSFYDALKEAFSHKGYILLNAGFFVCGFQITLIATHIPGYMQEREMGGWSATIILALIGLFNIIGTLGMGYLGTKFRKKICYVPLCSESIINRHFYFSPPSMIMSIVWNFFWITMAVHCPSYKWYSGANFGTKYLSSLFGIVFLSHQVGAFIGAYLGGYFYDNLSLMITHFYMAIALSIFATIVHYPINENPLVKNNQPIYQK